MISDEIREAAGIRGDEPDLADRLAALQLLVEQGATVDDIVADGANLGMLAAKLTVRRGQPTLSRAEIAERAGVDVEVVSRLWRTIGFPDPGVDARVASEADVEMVQLFVAASQLFGEDATLQLARVFGAASAKIADAIVSAFIANLTAIAADENPSELAQVQANLTVGELQPMMWSTLQQMLRLHLLAAIRPQVTSGAQGYETRELAIGFVDLVGSTVLASQMSSAELGGALTEFEEQAADIVVGRGGRVIKLIGDEIMFAFADTEAACDAAFELVATFEQHPVLPRVRGGLAFGDVLMRGGDCFGPVVNMAARVVREAAPGEVVVDEEIIRRVRRDLEPLGLRELKGFAAPVELARLLT